MTSLYTSPAKTFYVSPSEGKRDNEEIRAIISKQMTKDLLASLCNLDQELLRFILKGL